MVGSLESKSFSVYLETSSFFTFAENALHTFDIWDTKFKSLSIVTPRHLQLLTTVIGLLSSLISFNGPMNLSLVKIIR